jgi:hypothetical protein
MLADVCGLSEPAMIPSGTVFFVAHQGTSVAEKEFSLKHIGNERQ